METHFLTAENKSKVAALYCGTLMKVLHSQLNLATYFIICMRSHFLCWLFCIGEELKVCC